jgi:hypothetical protein
MTNEKLNYKTTSKLHHKVLAYFIGVAFKLAY